MKKQVLLLLSTTVILFTACNNNKISDASTMKFTITEKPFGVFENDSVTQYTITNPSGMQVSILNYGGTVTNIITPDKEGKMGDLVLGFDSLAGYLQKTNPYFGCLVGRYGNRIAKGKFSIDNQVYQLTVNDHGNTLHGGTRGLDKVIWKASKPAGDSSLLLTYTSKDGDQGFPGNLTVEVMYTVTADNALQITYNATTDKATPVNLTNHCYFNLSGGKEATVLTHDIMIMADKYTAVDSLLIPTGQLPDVKGTPMDFTSAKAIDKEIAAVKGGYDHNWVLNKKGEALAKVATAYDAGSGRLMEVFTTEPGLQFYTGNFLDSTLHGKNKRVYAQHAAFCMETQHFPDGPNQPSFPNTILKPGEKYSSVTRYRFSIK
ncbi:MAG: aldose epimerase family protein [Bacteroidota bacterium]